MINYASCLLAYADGPQSRSLHERLAHHAYRGPLIANGADALVEAARTQPDIVIIGPELSDMTDMELVRRLKGNPKTAHIPVLTLAERGSERYCAEALDAGIDDTMALPADETVLLARLRPLVRMATMHAELRLRSMVARGIGINAPDHVGPSTGSEPAVVLAFGGEADAAELRAALGPTAEIVTTADLYQIEDMVMARNFDAAVLFSGRNPAPHLDLCAQMRNNPRLFNLPVVLVTDPDLPIDPSLPYRQGASRVVTRPVQPAVMRASVVPLVRRQRVRWAIRNALIKTMAPASHDPLSDVYNEDFLLRYLAERSALARSRDSHMSLVMFYVPSLAGTKASFGDEAEQHLLRKLSQWINGLLRVEDLTARSGPHEFCVALPDTPLHEAEIAMYRIAGVLAHTDFAVPDVYEVVQVWLQVAAIELKPDDTPETLMARARAQLE